MVAMNFLAMAVGYAVMGACAIVLGMIAFGEFVSVLREWGITIIPRQHHGGG